MVGEVPLCEKEETQKWRRYSLETGPQNSCCSRRCYYRWCYWCCCCWCAVVLLYFKCNVSSLARRKILTDWAKGTKKSGRHKSRNDSMHYAVADGLYRTLLTYWIVLWSMCWLLTQILAFPLRTVVFATSDLSCHLEKVFSQLVGFENFARQKNPILLVA